jgi:hypothetical protein
MNTSRREELPGIKKGMSYRAVFNGGNVPVTRFMMVTTVEIVGSGPTLCLM